MTQTVLPQLKEIASDLAAQEAALIEQLEAVRNKLDGVRTVLPLFGEESGTDASQSAATSSGSKSSAAAAGSSTEAAKAPDADDDSSKSSSATAKKSSAKSSTRGATKTTAKKTRKTTTKKSRTGKKKDGRTASWQKFTRPGVKEKTVPEAVRLVLETQPDKSFKIAEVMNSLFKDDMPKQQYLKARNRISNILSGGVRDGEWYKGDRGTYSLTEQ